jgi:hypothetical protein
VAPALPARNDRPASTSVACAGARECLKLSVPDARPEASAHGPGHSRGRRPACDDRPLQFRDDVGGSSESVCGGYRSGGWVVVQEQIVGAEGMPGEALVGGSDLDG